MGRFDMEGETWNTCPNCGAPVKEGASFCTKCGAALAPVEGAAAAAAPPTGEPPPSPPSETPPVPPPGTPPQGTAAAAPAQPGAPTAKRGKAPLILGIIGGVLVIGGIVALVLYLTVWSGGGGGADTPQALSQKYIDAMEKGDVDAYMACFPPDFFEDVPFMEELGIDLKDLLETSFQFLDVKFDGVSLQVESETGDRAVVVTTKGTMLIDTLGMEVETDLADQPLEFTMVKENGNWYLTEDPMQAVTGTGIDLDLENLEDLDLDQFDLQLEEDSSSGG
jgi:hypothetical protein